MTDKNLNENLYDIHAEQVLLGALMRYNEAWDTAIDLLTANDFKLLEHQVIFSAMSDLLSISQPADNITLANRLRTKGDLDKLQHQGGVLYLAELMKIASSMTNISQYAKIIRDKSTLRSLHNITIDINDLIENPNSQEVEEIVNIAENKIFAISDGRPQESGPVAVKDIVREVITKIQDSFATQGELTGLDTGFRKLNEYTSGLQKGELIIVAARPGMGKTSFSMNIVENAINSLKQKDNNPIAVFSLEMPTEQITTRMISSISKINYQSIKNGKLEGDQFNDFMLAARKLQQSNLYIDDTPGISPAEIRSRLRRIIRAEQGKNLALVVIDYLQLMRVPGYKGDNRVNEISEISRSLKAISKEFACPVIALSQLNRGIENRSDKRPMMSDLRESGAIEQDADIIIFIYRPEVYGIEGTEGQAEIVIGKHRSGSTGSFQLTFSGEHTRFYDADYSH